MLIKPGLAVSEMSGKFGGVVAAHNRFGQYFRQYRIPTDPQSSTQMQRRAAMAASVVAWKGLTDAQRETWNVYAANTPWLNRLGETVYLSGFQMYCRSNTYWRYLFTEMGISPVNLTSCGSTGGLPENISAAVATVSVASGLSLAYDDTAAWCDSDGAAVTVQMSRPRPGTQVFGAGPYRYALAISGSSTTPPTSPEVLATASLPWSIAIGDRVDFLCRAITSEFTLSNPVKVSAVVVA